MTRGVIMAGGFGTRLRPLTISIPKPMAPLANAPMMEHIVSLLKRHDITELLGVLYHQPDVITKYFGNGKAFGVNMDYVLAAADYGTAGAIKNAGDNLDKRFIIISGDVLCDFDLSKAIKFHEDKGALATILLTRVSNPLAYGIVLSDENHRITRFLEKPSWGEVFSDTINTGIYILEPEVLNLIPLHKEFDFGKDLFPLMLRQKLALYGFVAEGYWRDIGNLNEYQMAHTDILKGRVSVQLKGSLQGTVISGENCVISPEAKLSGNVVLGNGVVVESHASLSECFVGDNCHIGGGSAVHRSVVWNNTTIGTSCDLSSDVVCNDCTIGDGVTIGENVFVAEHCSIGDGAELHSNIKLWNAKTVEPFAKLSHSLVQEEKWVRELFTGARITGLSNIEMNPEFGAKLGASIGNALGSGAHVVASRDSDAVSRIVKRSIGAGLMSAGVNVADLQTTPIPQARQHTRNGAFKAGLHVRKSIRNPNKTDIILFASDGRDIPLDTAKKIERYFFGEDIKRAPQDEAGGLSFPERQIELYISGYLDKLNTSVISDQKYKLLVDYSYGMASAVFPNILGRLNCTVLAMNSYVDAVRAAVNTYDPVNQEEVSNVMRSLGYQLGFKIDPGAERIALVDERGYWFSSMRLATIITKLFLETNNNRAPYKIAAPIEVTSEIDTIAKEYGVEVIRIKNSHSAMMEVTRDPDVALVSGSRGGFIFTEYMFAADALFSIAKTLEMLAATGYQLAEMDQSLPKRHQSQTSVACPWDKKGRVMRMAMEYSEGYERELIDGIKIIDKDYSVLLYPDKERAEFHILTESDDLEYSRDLSAQYAKLVSQWRD